MYSEFKWMACPFCFCFCLFVCFVFVCFFCFFIKFCSSCGMEWDTARRPANDLFWAIFIIWCTGASSTPKQYLLSLASLKKYLLGIHLKKIIFPAPFQGKSFCTSLQIWDEVGVTWHWLSRGFFFFLLSKRPLILNIRFSWLFLESAC